MAREERSGNGCGGSSSSSSSSSSSTILQFVPFCSLVDEGFWQRLSYLKLNKYGIDDSPIPITGFYAPCSHSRVSNHLTLLADSLPPDENGQSSMPAIVVTGTDALDKRSLLKEEANKIWEDIHTERAMENSVVLSRFLLILFADLEKWSFHYWFAFPALVLDHPAMLIESNVLWNGSPQKRMFADSDIANSTSSSELPLGILPHQIRGSLFQFSQMTLVGHSSNSCTACCSTVVSEYQKRGIEFLLQAINRPTYLEDLTGLTE